MQHHYVVCYDDELKKWYLDVDTAMAIFHQSPVFDGVLWVEEPSEELNKLYLDKEEALANLIDWAQGGE